MSAVLTERTRPVKRPAAAIPSARRGTLPLAAWGGAALSPGAARAGAHAGCTLEATVTTAWRSLEAGAATACPACGGTMDGAHSGGARQGTCGCCGTTLL
jgi:hypothetical protein